MGLNRYKNKKILILGLGREGSDSLEFFLKNCPKNQIGVADIAPFDSLGKSVKEILSQNTQIKVFCGKNYLSSLKKYDLVVKTPGIPIHLPEIEQAYREGKITSQIEIFLEQCQGMIIGITGTKGKSTTSSIIHEIIKKSGKKAYLLGNIGIPALSFLKNADKNSIFICELSAHQLYKLKKSPHISVLLNIYPEHLDYYKNYHEYIRAKANIAIYQSKNDYLIYNSANTETNKIAQKSASRKIAFNQYQWKLPVKTKLIGEFNLENAKIGAIIGRLLKIPDKTINAAIAEFKPLANRLEFVGNFKGIDFYNDSLSTIQESAVAAIEALGNRIQTLIAGGFDRGQPLNKLASTILKSDIKTLILFPVTGKRLWSEINKLAKNNAKNRRLKYLKPYFVETMDKAVDIAFLNTNRGRICLLSAAAASFNIFKDYADRANKFKKALTARSLKSE